MARLTSDVNLLDFTIKIEKVEALYRASLVEAPVGAGAIHQFKPPVTDRDLSILARLSGRSAPRRSVDSVEKHYAKEIGSKMFNAVFDGDLLAAFNDSVADLKANDRHGVRINFDLSKSPELLNFPWEFLYNPADSRFLAMYATSPIVRLLDLPPMPEGPPIELPLRIVCVVSNPEDVDEPLKTEQEWENLQKALHPLREEGYVAVERLPSARFDELEDYLEDGARFDIFHFIGHGAFDFQNQEGTLLFQNQRNRSDKVTGEVLGAIIRDYGIRLAVLNACEGARTSYIDPFAGVAQSLVFHGIPAVVAMQFEISDAAALGFSYTLYDGLARGLPVDVALARTRKKILASGSALEWATPVLYTRIKDGGLFAITPLDSGASSAVSPVAQHLSEPVKGELGSEVHEIAVDTKGQRLPSEAVDRAEDQPKSIDTAPEAQDERFSSILDFDIELTPGHFVSHINEDHKDTTYPLQTLALDGQISAMQRSFAVTSTQENVLAQLQHARNVGEALFYALIQGEVAISYRAALRKAEAEGSLLRFNLGFTDCESLWKYPWELLRDPWEHLNIAASNGFSFVRLLNVAKPVVEEIAHPARVLIIHPSPQGLKKVGATEIAALKKLADDGSLHLTLLEEPTLGDLDQALDAQRFGYYQVIHFIGHGGINAEKTSYLIFNSQSGDGSPVDSEHFVSVVRNHGVRLAILHADGPLSTFAIALLRARFSAVIAPQLKITESAAVAFSEHFYKRLAQRVPIDVAVAKARRTMLAVEETIHWATPALYMSFLDLSDPYDERTASSSDNSEIPIRTTSDVAAAPAVEADGRVPEVTDTNEDQRSAPKSAGKDDTQGWVGHEMAIGNAVNIDALADKPEEQRSAEYRTASDLRNRGIALARLGRFEDAAGVYDELIASYENSSEPDVRELITTALKERRIASDEVARSRELPEEEQAAAPEELGLPKRQAEPSLAASSREPFVHRPVERADQLDRPSQALRVTSLVLVAVVLVAGLVYLMATSLRLGKPSHSPAAASGPSQVVVHPLHKVALRTSEHGIISPVRGTPSSRNSAAATPTPTSTKFPNTKVAASGTGHNNQVRHVSLPPKGAGSSTLAARNASPATASDSSGCNTDYPSLYLDYDRKIDVDHYTEVEDAIQCSAGQSQPSVWFVTFSVVQGLCHVLYYNSGEEWQHESIGSLRRWTCNGTSLVIEIDGSRAAIGNGTMGPEDLRQDKSIMRQIDGADYVSIKKVAEALGFTVIQRSNNRMFLRFPSSSAPP